MDALVINETLSLPSDELSFTAARSSGAGGQNVNKVASKVELHFDLIASKVLSGAVKARILARPDLRRDKDGQVVVVSQLTRDQSRNLADARQRLRELIVSALIPPKKRRPTRPTLGSKRRRVADKRHLQEKKQGRRERPDSRD